MKMWFKSLTITFFLHCCQQNTVLLNKKNYSVKKKIMKKFGHLIHLVVFIKIFDQHVVLQCSGHG